MQGAAQNFSLGGDIGDQVEQRPLRRIDARGFDPVGGFNQGHMAIFWPMLRPIDRRRESMARQ
jgi:hypothetical protein